MKANIYTQRRISMLTPQSRQRVYANLVRHQFQKSGTTKADGKPRPEVFKHVPVQRSRVFTGTPQKGTCNHQSGFCQWQGEYYYVFSNSQVDEEVPGMRTMITTSTDLVEWREPWCLAAGDVKADMWRQTGGIMAFDDRLVAFVQTKIGHHLTSRAGMSAADQTKTQYRVSIFVSKDAQVWNEQEAADDCYWFEAPRLTQENRLLCAGSCRDKPIVFLWPGSDPTERPQAVDIPYDQSHGLDSGRFPYGEASWYQTDEGDILLFHRNETDELRLRVALSSDGGRSWSEPMQSDIPDSMSRVHAGRLTDGRYYLINNAIADLLNRIPLAIWISEDGYRFNEQYILLDEPTQISFPGALKAHGYQYPSSMAEDERLLVSYSVNKEHMEIMSVKVSDLL